MVGRVLGYFPNILSQPEKAEKFSILKLLKIIEVGAEDLA